MSRAGCQYPLRTLRGTLRVTIYQAEEYLRPSPHEREAELLGIQPGHPLQEIARLAMSIDRKPVEWRVSRCLTTDHRYVCIID